jgi:hypothetical protein
MLERIFKSLAILFILFLCYLLTKAEQEYIDDVDEVNY